MRASVALLAVIGLSVCGADIEITPLKLPADGKTGFTALAPAQTGIQFTNRLSDGAAERNRIYELGSGVALGDVDGDGLCDIYLARMEGNNALYRNLGNWRFEEITAKSGVACPQQYSTGAVFADIDADGDLDLLVTGIGFGSRLFLNDGKGVFARSEDCGLVDKFGATSMALADVDGDGDIDLYVCNYRTTTSKDNPNEVKVEARRVDGRIVVSPEDRFEPVVSKGGGVIVVEKGEPDIFYLNDGKGHFTAVSWTDGHFLDEDGKSLAHPPRDWGLSAAFRDVNGDGLPDLYVCNDFFYSPDRLWMNQGKGVFRAVDRHALRNMSMSSMSVDFADINRDGWDDFFVADMLSPRNDYRQRQRANVLKGDLDLPFTDPAYRPEVLRNTLCLNRGDGTFAEIAQLAGVEATEWTWGSVFLDVDLDGYEDLLLTTGNNHDVLDADAIQQRARRMPRLFTPTLAFRNNRDLTFSDHSREWGFYFVGVSQGIALGDLDNDGDLDVVVNRLNSAPGIFQNETAAPRIAIRIPTVGARIRVTGAAVVQTQTIQAGGRYLSSDQSVRTFAAGAANIVEIFWPSGNYSRFDNVPGNVRCVISEPKERRSPRPAAQQPRPLFEEVTVQAEPHFDEPFDDFARQPLLPYRLSQLGPPVVWLESSNLFVGAGKGGRPQLLRWSSGRFSPDAMASLSNPAARDQASAAKLGDGLVVVSSNYEDGSPTGAAIQQFSRGLFADLASASMNTFGPCAVADIDGDGDLDLFVGGRVQPGRYPEAVDSILFLNSAGKFHIDPRNQKIFEGVGLVTGAVFSDIDGDGDSDLALSCEWGSPRVFVNDHGVFSEATARLGLEQLTGWWTSIAAADLNGDGAPDLVLGNFGRNTKYQRHLPTRIYYGDLDHDGALEVIEAWRDSFSNRYVPVRDFDSLSKAIPDLRERITSYRAFGRASIEEVLGDSASKLKMLSARTFDSCVLWNRKTHFEVQSLPVEAQFAPVMGIAVADFDQDGRPDLFLSQNFFDVEIETSRYDAGLGLLLLNQTSGFKALTAAESGIRIYGEQRGCAAADFDHDGAPDLAVGVNRGVVRVFRGLKR